MQVHPFLSDRDDTIGHLDAAPRPQPEVGLLLRVELGAVNGEVGQLPLLPVVVPHLASSDVRKSTLRAARSLLSHADIMVGRMSLLLSTLREEAQHGSPHKLHRPVPIREAHRG